MYFLISTAKSNSQDTDHFTWNSDANADGLRGRRQPDKMTISSVSRMWIWWLWLLLGGGVGVTFAQDCAQSEVTKIAVASVFGTLAVVLLVLGIAIFVLWRRRRGK